MKILLCCSGGLSTSVLMNKMKQYAQGKGIELEIKAVGLGALDEEKNQGWECVLVGPQVSFNLKNIQDTMGVPCAVVNTMDYAMANSENVFKQASKLTEK